MALGPAIDLVVLTDRPEHALAAVFGLPYSNKIQWP
jgi:hypothetical protein